MSYAALKRSLIILLVLVLALHINSSLYCTATEPKRIALTFDDGPHYKYTEEILDILKKYDVRATFFTVGTNVERFPELVQRELSEGHEVANHTYSHDYNFIYESPENFLLEINSSSCQINPSISYVLEAFFGLSSEKNENGSILLTHIF